MKSFPVISFVLLIPFWFTSGGVARRVAAEEPMLGEIRLVGFNFAPTGWALCDGQLLPIRENQALFQVLGTTFGGDGKTTFRVPDLRGRSAVHPGAGPGRKLVKLGETVGGEKAAASPSQEVEGAPTQPFLALRYVIAVRGVPNAKGVAGEIRLFAGNSAPNGWELCDGQELPVEKYRSLYGAIGDTFGGDGKTRFAVPDLRGRAAMHSGHGSGLDDLQLGQARGGQMLAPATIANKSVEITRAGLGINHIIATNEGESHTTDEQRRIIQQQLRVARAEVGVITAQREVVQAQDNECKEKLKLLELVPPPEGSETVEELRARVASAVAALEAYDEQLDMAEEVVSELEDALLPADWEGFVGEIRLTAARATPRAWESCDGQLVQLGTNEALFSLIGTYYGGDGRATFGLPDLRGRIPVGAGKSPLLDEMLQGARGGGRRAVMDSYPENNPTTMPSLGVRYIVCQYGIYPSRR